MKLTGSRQSANEDDKVVSLTHLTRLALQPQARVFLRVFGSSHGLSVIYLDPGIFVFLSAFRVAKTGRPCVVFRDESVLTAVCCNRRGKEVGKQVVHSNYAWKGNEVIA